MSNPGFTPDNIRSKSSAAAGLCGWVINICKYFRIYQVGGGDCWWGGGEGLLLASGAAAAR